MLNCLSAAKYSCHGGSTTKNGARKTSLSCKDWSVLKGNGSRYEMWLVLWCLIDTLALQAWLSNLSAWQCPKKEFFTNSVFLSLYSLCAYYTSRSCPVYISINYHSTICVLFCSSSVLELMLTVKQDSQLLNLSLSSWHRLLFVSVAEGSLGFQTSDCHLPVTFQSHT